MMSQKRNHLFPEPKTIISEHAIDFYIINEVHDYTITTRAISGTPQFKIDKRWENME